MEPAGPGRLTRDWGADSARSETDEFGRTLYGEADRPIVEAVATIAAERGVSRAQVALAWIASRPGVTAPIVGAGKPGHIQDAVAALTLTLTEDEIDRLERPYTPRPVAGFA